MLVWAVIAALVIAGIGGALVVLNGPVALGNAATATIRPYFDDPRLSITLAYPFRNETEFSNATGLPMDYLPQEITREFETTIDVYDCTVTAQDGSAVAECRVAPGANVIAMAELLRRLADKQYYQINLDLTLDDGATRTRYVWDSARGAWDVLPQATP